jgi:galactokinase
MKCGIMDQFASVFGRKDHLIQLDCRTKEYEYVPFKLEGITVLLLDSNVKHSLASSEYNTRRQECEKGVELIQQQYPEVQSLRDATMAMVDACIRDVDEVVYRRCRYVVGEIQRLQEACEDLRKGDLAAFGKKMFETHDGLSKDYEVSCEELDYLADYVRNNPDVLGARMMGGGFGGCTINLVKTTAVEALVKGLEAPYQAAFGKPFKHYVASIEDGTTVL